MDDLVKFEVDIAGFCELRTSPEVTNMVYSLASRVSHAAGGTYRVTVKPSGGSKARAWATVSCDDKKTYIQNLKTNTLLKALGSVSI